jgi:hypothetical protein
LDLPDSLYKAIHTTFATGRMPSAPAGGPPPSSMPAPVPVSPPSQTQPPPPSYIATVSPPPQSIAPVPMYQPVGGAMDPWPPSVAIGAQPQSQPVMVSNPFMSQPWPPMEEHKSPPPSSMVATGEDVLSIPSDLIAPGPPTPALRRILEFILKEPLGDDTQLAYVKTGLSNETQRGTPVTKSLLRELIRQAALASSPSSTTTLAPPPSYAAQASMSPSPISSPSSIPSLPASTSGGVGESRPSSPPASSLTSSEGAINELKVNNNNDVHISSHAAAPAANDQGEGTAVMNPFAMPFAPSEGVEVKVPSSPPRPSEGMAISPSQGAIGVPGGPLSTEIKESKDGATDIKESKTTEVKDPTLVCGICKGSKDTPTILDCSHLFCASCIRSLILELVEQKNVVGMACPFPGCRREMSQSNIKVMLTSFIITRLSVLSIHSIVVDLTGLVITS